MPQATTPDDRLAARASKGDQRAVAAIFKRYHQPLYRYCAAIVGNPEDARDALQNTMVKLLGALPGERRRIQLKPWLYRVAHNESVEILRRRRPLEELEPEALAGDAGPEASAETRERLRHLIADLGELPERQRGALVMRELGGLGFEEIGAAFETSGAVARQTVYEARLGLQEMERGRTMACDEVRRKLSDGDRRVFRRRDVRAHLRHCAGCREFERGIGERRQDLAALAPLPALAAAGLLKGVLGGAVGSVGGALGGVGGTIAGSTAAKAVATVAVAGAIGVTAADRADVIHVFPGAGGNAVPAQQDSGAAGAQQGPGGGAAPGLGAGDEAGGDRGENGEVGGRAQVGGGRQATPADQGGTGGEPANGAAGSAASSGNGLGRGPNRSGAGNGRGAAHGKGHVKGQGAGSANAHGANPNSQAGKQPPAQGNGNQAGGQAKGQAKDVPSPAAGKEPPEKSAGREAKPAVPPSPPEEVAEPEPQPDVEAAPPAGRGKPAA